MAWSLQEVSDRLEIHDTITRYSYGLDQRLWKQWDLAFTPDAILDFSTVGLSEMTTAAARELFTKSDPIRHGGQHLLLNTLITLAGDTATARSELLLFTSVKTDVEGKAQLNSGGGWYDDDLVRTADGWRIRRRAAHMKWIKTETIDWPLTSS